MGDEKKKESKSKRVVRAVIKQRDRSRTKDKEGRRRVMIERVSPEIDGGRFAIKRVVGETVHVEADIFADGHDELSGALLYRREKDPEWSGRSLSPS